MLAGVGLVLGGRSTLDELDKKCGGDTSCPPSAKPTYDYGRLITGIGEVAVGVGTASLITGIILIATSRENTEAKAAKVRFIGASPGANLGGLSLVGKF